jgi:hypothetical protein
MYYKSVEEIPEWRYIETLLAGAADEDAEEITLPEDDEDLGKDEDDELPVDIIHIK